MRKLFLPVSVLCLLTTFLFFPVVKAGSNINSLAIPAGTVKSNIVNATSLNAEAVAISLYDSLELNNLGMSKEALLYAFKGQQKLEAQGVIENPDILTVCDFTQSSDKKRMYIIDIKNYKVLVNTYVAHGKNTGLSTARKFSNKPESLQSSLGFYVTKGTYFGKHGLSLKLSGQEQGFNDNAEARAVVVHGAGYIGEQRSGAPYMGRSFGCPAVPQQLATKVINLIKNGTCLFIYYPSQKYLHGSKILNG